MVSVILCQVGIKNLEIKNVATIYIPLASTSYSIMEICSVCACDVEEERDVPH